MAKKTKKAKPPKDRIKKTEDWLSGLRKLLEAKEPNPEDDDIPPEKRKMYFDRAHVMGIIPKTQTFQNLMQTHFILTEGKIPTIDYTTDTAQKSYHTLEGIYSTEYLSIFHQMSKQYKHCVFRMTPEKPLMLETDDFIVLLAPRIDYETKNKKEVKDA